MFSFQDVAHVSLASILLREGQLEDAAVVIKKALEVTTVLNDISKSYPLELVVFRLMSRHQASLFL